MNWKPNSDAQIRAPRTVLVRRRESAPQKSSRGWHLFGRNCLGRFALRSKRPVGAIVGRVKHVVFPEKLQDPAHAPRGHSRGPVLGLF